MRGIPSRFGPIRGATRWIVSVVLLLSVADVAHARRSRRKPTGRALRNFRDAGALTGLPRNRVFRSDDPRYRPRGTCRRLRQAGIQTIVKLNGYQHRLRPGFRPFWRRGPCGIRELVVSLPYDRTRGARGMDIYQVGRRRLSRRRLRVVRYMERQLAATFKELARLKPRQLPVLIHCSLGRDRTGVVLAMLQRLAGVDLAAVSRDYVASRKNVGSTSAYHLRKTIKRMRPMRHFLRKTLGLNYWEVARLRRLMRGPRKARPANAAPRPATLRTAP